MASQTFGIVPIITPAIAAPVVRTLRHREAETVEAETELVASAAPVGIGALVEIERKVAPDVLQPRLDLPSERVELRLLLIAERCIELLERGAQRLERGLDLLRRRLQLLHARGRALVGAGGAHHLARLLGR